MARTRISATGACNRRNSLPVQHQDIHNPNNTCQGFTLLEVLVVVMIIGVTPAVAFISLPTDQGKELEKAGKRLSALIDLARQQASIGGQERAMEVKEETYRFLSQSETSWAPISSGALRPRTLPQGMRLDLVMEGQSLLEKKKDSTDEDEPEPPRIFILSSGELSEFELTLSLQDHAPAYQVTGQISGTLSLTKIEP